MHGQHRGLALGPHAHAAFARLDLHGDAAPALVEGLHALELFGTEGFEHAFVPAELHDVAAARIGLQPDVVGLRGQGQGGSACKREDEREETHGEDSCGSELRLHADTERARHAGGKDLGAAAHDGR